MPLTGEVIYLYAYDLAYEMKREPIGTLLGQPVQPFQLSTSKPGPRQMLFSRPQMVKLPVLEQTTLAGPIRLEQSLKLLPIGALSIMIRCQFEVAGLDELIPYHALAFTDGTTLYEHVHTMAQQILKELEPHLIRPVAQVADEEAYTVFCLNAPPGEQKASDWLPDHRREAVALLTEEKFPARLSAQEIDESSQRHFSYYEQDLVVVDWDAALVIDEKGNWDEVVYVMELANVQLAELEAYDRMLDETARRIYRYIAPARFGHAPVRSIVRDLREIRVDLARVDDELSNITKFFGDWHLARIYQGLAERFHLPEWHRNTDEKLKTLDNLHQLLREEHSARWMMILEIAIVVLFVLDIVILLAGIR